jgi:mannose-1-phosphate guanylyltransferase/mannose-6-phosphate isomerase
MRPVVPVVLSGGSGTRLWPLSRPHHPKQFHALVAEETLFQQTLLRTQGIAGVERPLVICNEAHRFLVAEQVRETGLAASAIVLEPAGRNTAPAVTAAALLVLRETEAGDDPLLLVLAADHVILDTEAFRAAVASAVEAAGEGYLVTFGVVPTKPETGYGYLLKGDERGAWSELTRFVEKPDAATAERYVASGRYLWNSGMFLFSARSFLAELERLEPAMLAGVAAAVADAKTDPDFIRLGAAFGTCPADSIDYAVMERTDKAAVVPLDAGWSDVGSWAALHEVLEKDSDGNVLRGDVLVEACRNSYVASASRRVGVVGLENVVVVESEDAVLVMSQREAQQLKRLVERLEDEES